MKTKAVYVTEGLHRRVKLIAARRGRPLKSVIESLIERGLSAEEAGPDVTTEDLQALAARGGSFDFLASEREDVYSLEEGEPIT